MNSQPHYSATSCCGFTLVELAVTSFLIAVGLLGVYSLLRTGIETSTDQEKEIRGALFADSVFATLSVAAQEAANAGGATNWVAFWTDFCKGTTNLPLPGATSINWPAAADIPGALHRDFAAAPAHKLLAGGGLHAWVYDGLGVASNTVWYDFSEPSWLPSGSTNYSAIGMTLHVWPESPQSSAQTYFQLFCLQIPPAE